MTQPLISFVIPTRNRGPLLFRTVSSLCERLDGANFEIIISDNCSSDNTRELVDKLKKDWKDTRIIYLQNLKDVGMSLNIAKGIEASVGIYVQVLTDHVLATAGISNLYAQLNASDSLPVLVVINELHGLTRPRYSNQLVSSLSIDAILSEHGLCITWLCAIVFSRQLAYRFASYIRRDSSQSLLPHTHFLLEIYKPDKITVLRINFLSVLPVYKKGGYNILNVFILDYLSLVQYLYLIDTITHKTLYSQARLVLAKFLPFFVAQSIIGASYSYSFALNKSLLRILIFDYPLLASLFCLNTLLSLIYYSASYISSSLCLHFPLRNLSNHDNK